jgi:hypothetical protein
MTGQQGHAGTTLPVPDDFDFESWTQPPPCIEIEDGYPLPSVQIRNRENVAVELFNDESILATVNCMRNRASFPDVGEPLKPFWPYFDDEIAELAADEEYRKSVGPLPNFLRKSIQAVKEQRKTEGIEGSLILTNPISRAVGKPLPSDAPLVYLQTLKQGISIPLTWFSNDRLRQAKHSFQSVHTKQIRPEATKTCPNPDKVTVLDMAKMESLWGSDESPYSMSAWEFIDCAKNLQATMDRLCGLGSSSGTTHAIQLSKHFQFFRDLDRFESTFHVWYPFEWKSRHEIIRGVLFDAAYYNHNVSICIAVADESDRRSSKRPADSEHRVSKAPRGTNTSPASFRTKTQPCCVICGGDHLATLHSPNITSFQDGKPLFSVYREGGLFIANPKNGKDRRICLSFQLPRGCSIPGHETERAHICSLCGGVHAALSRNSQCTRVSDGKIRA